MDTYTVQKSMQMKAGDIVRFRRHDWGNSDFSPSAKEAKEIWEVGLLIEYHKWEKIATVLYDNAILRLAARDVQKFGRRYLDEEG